MSNLPSRSQTYGRSKHFLPFLLIAIAAALLLSRGLNRDLNHDEHQFLAPAALLSRDGLLPYQDYPLFHLPNLVFAYAAMEKVTGDLLLGAKLLAISGTIALVGILIGLIWTGEKRDWRLNFAASASGILLLLYDPVILFTSGKTWNHEVPSALIIGAIALQARYFAVPKWWIAACAGLLGGLAVGCRLTFGPMLIPLFVLAFLVPGDRRAKIVHGLCWSAGAFIGLLPSIWLFALAPEQFLFGNLEFPRLRLLDPTNARIQKTIRWSAKIRYFFKEIVRSSWPIFGLFILIAVTPAWRWIRSRKGEPLLGFTLLVLPFALFGCFAPSRYQYQHLFGVIALVATGAIVAIPNFVSTLRLWPRIAAIILIAGCGISAGFFSDKVKDLYHPLGEPINEWFVFDYPHQAKELNLYIAHGKVLTLSPALPLEAGLSVYPEFATGPFAWKSAFLVPEERAKRLHLVAPRDLGELLQGNPPAGILTGVEDEDLEEPLVKWAQDHAYQSVKLSRRRILWLPKAH